jgi:AcrR family transcriptional regulator
VCGTSRRSSRGSRPGAPDTRAEILAAARNLFAERGFGGTSMRAIAAAAGVDPALVHHYFDSKDDLFLAALEMPVDPRALLLPLAAEGTDDVADRMLSVFLTAWDDPQLQPALVGLARSLVDPAGSVLLREGFLPVVLEPVGEALALDRPELRMPLVASQVVGLILMRYVLRIEPLASMPAAQVRALYAPTLQRYLTGDLFPED